VGREIERYMREREEEMRMEQGDEKSSYSMKLHHRWLWEEL
jgi:hypothetical protein